MSNESCMNTPSILFCFSVPRCGLGITIFCSFSSKIKMDMLQWASVCYCGLPHNIDRTLHDPTGYGPRKYPILCAY
jgi:hypothetical protein